MLSNLRWAEAERRWPSAVCAEHHGQRAARRGRAAPGQLALISSIQRACRRTTQAIIDLVGKLREVLRTATIH
jgi:hypothetical protein